jgi:phosphohistidine phosphatase
MDLLVIRHAIARERAPREDDAARRLTPSGARRFRGVVRGLRKLDWRLETVLTSPWLRAARTAELLEPISTSAPIATELLCQSPRAELLATIAELRGAPRRRSSKKRYATAVVGHEPWLGELVSWLAFGDGRHHEALALKKGGVVWLEGSSSPGGMTLRALLPPGVLRAL